MIQIYKYLYSCNWSTSRWHSQIYQQMFLIENHFHVTPCIISLEICEQLPMGELLKDKSRQKINQNTGGDE